MYRSLRKETSRKDSSRKNKGECRRKTPDTGKPSEIQEEKGGNGQYICIKLLEKNLSKKGGKIFAFFIDLKAAFDSMDRCAMLEAMREREVREGEEVWKVV